MRPRFAAILDHSIGMMLSAIEVYNKPDFKEREQVFAVLAVTAWESLLKARIVQQNKNRMSSIYIKDGGRFRRNRSGSHFTIGIDAAVACCSLDSVLASNLARLVEVRDAAVHLTAASPTLPYLVFTLGSATLRNYAKIVTAWFGRALSEYHFYILPLGFSYPFTTIAAADLPHEPEDVQKLIKIIAAEQIAGRTESDGFQLLCEIRTTLVSAKKITEATDLTAAVGDSPAEIVVVQRPINPLDQYPLTFTRMWDKLKTELPGIKQDKFLKAIRTLNIKGDARYSQYRYRSKEDEKRGPRKETAVIYNANAYQVILAELRKVD